MAATNRKVAPNTKNPSERFGLYPSHLLVGKFFAIFPNDDPKQLQFAVKCRSFHAHKGSGF
jgi:hypothetical protein